MKLTDQAAIQELQKARIFRLEIMINDYPEYERAGRSDREIIAHEAAYLLEKYRDPYDAKYEELQEARRILRTSSNPYDVQEAHEILNMYARLVRFVDRIQKK